MQIGDHFYWSYFLFNDFDDWNGGRLIFKSRIRSIHAPTGMYENHQGRYFKPEQCYSTLKEAKAALREWIQTQRELMTTALDDIEEELDLY